jgi:hypothetical protein
MERMTWGELAIMALRTRLSGRPVTAVRGSIVPYPRLARPAKERDVPTGRLVTPTTRSEMTMSRAQKNLALC